MPDVGPGEVARERFGREHPNVLLQAFAIQNLSRDALERAFAGLPLTPREWGVLSILRVFGPQTPTGLATFLGMAPTTLSSMSERLVRRRLVRRARNPADGRSYTLEVTAAGRKLLDAAGPRFQAVLDRLNAELGSDREAVLDAQEALTQALRRALAVSTKSQ
jgi:DNA-binding MarR family transcriptional regulator